MLCKVLLLSGTLPCIAHNGLRQQNKALHGGQKKGWSNSTQIAMLELLHEVLPTFFITHAVLGHTDLQSRWPLFLYMDTGLEVVNILLAPLV